MVIGTPGRMNDFQRSGILNFNQVQYLVVDECDRMLDMGFEPQLRELLAGCKPDRSTYMCSATLPKDVQKIADAFLTQPVLITMGYLGKTPAEITQELIYMDEEKKLDYIKEFLINKKKDDKIIVFVETKKKCNWLDTFFRQQNIDSSSIHGDKGQGEREKALNNFK